MAFIEKSGMGFKSVAFPVLKHKPSFRQQYITVQHHIRQLPHIFQLIWRVCKNYIVLLFTYRDKPENIHPDSMYALHTQLFCNSSYKLNRPAVAIQQVYVSTSSGGEFKAYAPGTCEKIKYFRIFKIKIIRNYVEQGFPCKIGCRP